MINFFNEKIELESKDDVIKLHMILKSYELKYHLSMAEINTLFELYKTGYSDTFYNNVIANGYFKTKQTVRNAITKMTKLTILSSKKRGERAISETFLPKIQNDRVMFQYLVKNINGN